MSEAAALIWIDAIALDDIPEDEGRLVRVNGLAIAVFRVGDEVFALEDACPHSKSASLSQGYVEDGVVECPLHQACFELRTGKVMSPPAEEDVRTYPTRVDGGRVLLGV